MSKLPADSPALPPSGASWLPGPKPPDEGWTQKKFYLVLGAVLAFHLALIFAFGAKNQIVPRSVAQVPHLQLTDGRDEFIALGDPTLFARPNAHDAVTAFWRRAPVVTQPDFSWNEAPHYLPPTPGDFGAGLGEYVRSREAVEFPLNFKPEPKLDEPAATFAAVLPQATTGKITGDLAQRQLLTTDKLHTLPSLPRNDVIAPTKVQALVDLTGNVASVVVLESSGDSAADQLAVQLARNLRFAPTTSLTFGEITFTWHTVPASSP
jgi:TonB family protein